MAEPITRASLLAQAQTRLLAAFEEISASVPHRGLKGTEVEQILAEFLRKYLPKRFDVGSGYIIDLNEGLSRQTDVIIYDAHNCPVLRASETSGIYPVDNVAAVIEVKSMLNKAAIYDAAEKIAVVKSLVGARSRDLDELEFRQPMGILVAFDSELSSEKQFEHYANSINANGGLLRHIDLIVVLGRSIQTLHILTNENEWHMAIFDGIPNTAEGIHIGMGIMPLGDATLDYFYRLLVARLARFRPIMAHPGFKPPDGVMIEVRYISSLSNDPDPQMRLLKEFAYRQQAIDIMNGLGNQNPADAGNGG